MIHSRISACALATVLIGECSSSGKMVKMKLALAAGTTSSSASTVPNPITAFPHPEKYFLAIKATEPKK